MVLLPFVVKGGNAASRQDILCPEHCDYGNADGFLQGDAERLAAVVDAWPDLPEAIRAGIVAMVRAART
ncbi:MAG: hypothetical protein WBX00_05245 [Isosphaeraceae bacterium]